MDRKCVLTVTLLALCGIAASAPLQNTWNSLRFDNSNEDNSNEDYGYGMRGQYDYSSPRSSSSSRLYRDQSIENDDDSREYGRQSYSTTNYGTLQRFSPYSGRRVNDKSREYGERYYGSMSYNKPSQRQQRPGRRYFYGDDDDSDEVYDSPYKHLYKQLQKANKWGLH